MWHTTHSTGVAKLDQDHHRLAEGIRSLSDAANPREERVMLLDLYCDIIGHIRDKLETPDFVVSAEERERDNAFLREIRIKIWERDNAHISQSRLIDDLQRMLAEHVLYNNQERSRQRQNA